jgi:hypothetical protein
MKQNGKIKLAIYFLFIICIMSNCTNKITNVYKGHKFTTAENGISQQYYYNDSLKFQINYLGTYNLMPLNCKNQKKKIPSQFKTLISKDLSFANILSQKSTNTVHAIIISDLSYQNNLNSSIKTKIFGNKYNELNFGSTRDLIYDSTNFYLKKLTNKKAYYFSKDTLKGLIFFEIPYSNKNVTFLWLISNYLKENEKLEKIKFQIENNILPMMASFDTLIYQKKLSKTLNPFYIGFNSFGENNYLRAVDSLIFYKTSLDTSKKNSDFWQSLATYSSFISDENSEMYSIKGAGRKYIINQNEIDSLMRYTYNYFPITAIDVISEEVKKHKIVILNDNHDNPNSRIFADSLLKPMFENGFKYLAVETVDYEDNLLNTRGFPIQKTGFYTKEPRFAEMLRHALKIGFKIIPYEDTLKCDFKDFLECLNFREFNQANNIKNILKKDSLSKIFIYAGYDHIYKTPNDGWIHMAQSLKVQTGINPLCIEQTQMIPKYNNEFENNFYKVLNAKYSFEKPMIFKNNKEEYLLPNNMKNAVDLQIYHPKLWKYNNMPKKLIINIPHKIKGNFILQLYLKNELEQLGLKDVIPVFNKRIVNHVYKYEIPVTAGKYTFLIRNINGEIVYSKNLIHY